jgi:hypothetical protein
MAIKYSLGKRQVDKTFAESVDAIVRNGYEIIRSRQNLPAKRSVCHA